MKLLQSSIDHIDPNTQTFEAALGKMLNNFSAPRDAPTNAVCCLRASLQVLVIYSITYGNCSWISFPETRSVEEASQRLANLITSTSNISKPPSVFEPDSIDKCRYHALLHSKKGHIELQRDIIVRNICTIASRLPLSKNFTHYNPNDTDHIIHTVDLLHMVTPQLRLIGEGISLTLNPVISLWGKESAFWDERTALLT